MGQDEDPLATVGRSNIGRAETTPLRIEPHLGKVGEDEVEAPRDERPDVFDEDVARRHFSDDACEFTPEPAALPVNEPPALASVGDILAGEASRDEIHSSTPQPAVEGGHVAPDRRWSQLRFFHARRQYGSGMSLPLNVTDRLNANSVKSEGETTGTSEELDGM